MTGNRHDRSVIEAFLDRDFRQVWAADRGTGEPRFLPDGQAAALRAVAKAEWRCPVPGCEVEITTVGGSSNRRHHFRHNQPSPHSSDGESEFHLAGKAMLAAWAEERKPEGASVQEERFTEKNPATSRYRIADVMVDWPNGDQTAFEVEYKQYDPEDWALKQSDYDNTEPHPVACVWIFGHLRIKRPPKNSYLAEDPTVVRLPLLGQRWIAAGRPALVINPVTREIGTILSEHPKPDGMAYPAPSDDYGRLFVDPLDACDLDPTRGIITPTMRHVDEADERRRAAEERHLRAEQKRRDEKARLQAERERRLALFEDIKRQQAETWEATPLAALFAKRWQTTPALLGVLPGETFDQSGIWAHPVHWRGAIYEELIRPYALGTEPSLDDMETGALLPPPNQPQFTPHDIRVALSVHNINTHKRDPKKAFMLVMEFLEGLQCWQVLAIHRDANGHPTHFEATGYPLDKAETDYQQGRLRAQALDEQRRAALETKEREQQAARERVTARKRTFTERVAAAGDRRPEVPATPYVEPEPDPERETTRSLCNRCRRPLPAWQQGGYHTGGCEDA